MAHLRLGFGRFFHPRRKELEEGRAAIERFAATVAEASKVLQAPMQADDLENEVSGQHEILSDAEPRPPR
jgi:hypothetical protein